MSSVAFVTEMKLRRLRDLRDVLRSRYDLVETEASRATAPTDKLLALYDGLRAINVAGQAFHPEITNLEAVLLRGDGATASAWVSRLERELAAGRLRTDVMYAYAALLGEWVSHERSDADADASTRITARITRPSAEIDRELIARVLDQIHPQQCSGFDDEPPFDMAGYVDSALGRIAGDPEKAAVLRGEARKFSSDSDLKKDLVDAMTMLFDGIDDWSWPADGFRLRSVWTGDRYRVHVDIDLVTAVLLDIVGARWTEMIAKTLRGNRNLRAQRVARLRELQAPAIILENEERMLAESSCGLLDDPALAKEDGADPQSVIARRAAVLAELMDAGLRASQYGGEYGTALRTLIHVTSAEVALARAVARPIYLVKTDIADFFPSVSHELVLLVARRFGIPERWQKIFSRYLAVLAQTEEGPRALSVGLPLGHDLSRLFGEMIVSVIETHVVRALPSVRMARLVDDIVLSSSSPEDIAEAFRRLTEIASGMGLRLSPEKSGSTSIGGGDGNPAGLPQGPFRIGGLELSREDGSWHPSDAAMVEAIDFAQRKIGEARSVLEAVSIANTHVRRLVASLAPSAPLGKEHLGRAAESVSRFQKAVFDGVLMPRLRDTISTLDVPLAWLHWPLTAGGLGLVDGHVELAPYLNAPGAPMPPPGAAIPDDLETSANAFATFYGAHLTAREPIEPAKSPLLDGLAADFVKRKDEMRGATPTNANATLAPYWRWVLSTYGRDVLDAFGSYRFLPHQLLPIYLIQSRRLRRSQAAAEPSTDDDIPF